MKFMMLDGDTAKNQPIHRLRIGGAGLLTVTLLTAGASLIMGRASDEIPIDEVANGSRSAENAAISEEKNNEPLVDLGVIPDLQPSEADPAQQKQKGTADGQVVPDLKPKSDIANDPQ